jgi:hypothetical protein|tara:strand:+ start:98 stop:1018 length:921 start_codon:yes stop_codon:yes gene_type:complete
MPNVNNIFRRGKVKKLNLESFDVFLEEEASLGPLVVSQYFNISRFPSILPGGNSYFEIEGSKLLKPEIELKTELLDSAGQPIFHYALPKSPKSKKLKVTMQTTSNVVNGVGRLIILGELNPNVIDVPEEFQDTYNVRLTGLVDINTSLPNSENIEFFVPPRMTVAEQVKGEIELPSDVDIMFVTKTGTATMTGDGIGFTAVADVGVGTDDITADNQADDKFEEFDKTKGDVGDFEDFQEPDIVGVGEELPEFISVPVINKVRIKNQNVDVGDSDEEESRPRTARTARAGNAARQPRRETTRQEQEL